MSKLKGLIFMSALISGVSVAHGEDCPPPPVETSAHAVCLAKKFAQKMFIEPSSGWEFEVKEMEGYWHIIPANIKNRDFKIEKSSGDISYGWGYI